MSKQSLAAPLAPYALHYELPHLKRRHGRHDRRTSYGIPLPPRVTPSPILVDHEAPLQIQASPRVEDARIITPRYGETVVVPVSKSGDKGLEQRIAVQDKNIELLLDRAVRIKEDLVSALGKTNANVLEERYARELLQQHINIMVLICQKLTQEVEFLWYQIKEKDGGSKTTLSSLRELELAHVQNMADVKGKAENLELTISHLGRDLRALADRERYTEKQWEQLMQQHLERYFGLDGKLSNVATKLDASFNEAMLHIRGLDKELENRMHSYEGQMRVMMEELRGELTGAKSTANSQLDKLDKQYQQLMIRQHEEFTKRFRDLEKNAYEAISLSGRQASELQRRVVVSEQRLKALEQVVAEQIASNTAEASINQVKNDMQQMFNEVRDTINNLDHVQDSKIRLFEDRISKDLAELRKFVVLV